MNKAREEAKTILDETKEAEKKAWDDCVAIRQAHAKKEEIHRKAARAFHEARVIYHKT
jgi:hypothetical protein